MKIVNPFDINLYAICEIYYFNPSDKKYTR